MFFKFSKTLIPNELKNNSNASQFYFNKGKDFIGITESGFTWIKNSNKLMMWNEDKTRQKEYNYYEISIPCHQTDFLTAIYESENKVVSVGMITDGLEFRYYSNLRFPSKFTDKSLKISPKHVTNMFCLRDSRFLFVCSDMSLMLVDISYNNISYQFVSEKGYLPVILNQLLSPFTRRSVCLQPSVHYFSKLSLELNAIIYYFKDSLKICFFELNDRPCIKAETKINNKDIITGIFSNYPIDETVDICEIEYIDVCSTNKYLYVLVHATDACRLVYHYFLVSLLLKRDFIFQIHSILLLEQPKMEKCSLCFIRIIASNNVAIILDSSFYLYDSSLYTINRVLGSNNEAAPICVEYCKKLKQCILLYPDYKILHFGSKQEETNNHSRMSLAASFETSISLYHDQSIVNPLNWNGDTYSHFETAFEKYRNNQKDLAISMVCGEISDENLKLLITKMIENIGNISNQTGSRSIYRKLDRACHTLGDFINFLKESKIYTRFLTRSSDRVLVDSVIFDLIYTIERVQLHKILFNLIDSSLVVQRLFSYRSPHSDFYPSEKEFNILLVFDKLVSMLEKTKHINDDEDKDVEQVAEILYLYFEIFEFTKSEIQNLRGLDQSLKIGNVAEFSIFIRNECLNPVKKLILWIIKKIDVNKTLFESLQIRDLIIKFLSVLKHFSVSFSTDTSRSFYSVFRLILNEVENLDHIADAIDIAAHFLCFEDVCRLCIDHRFIELLSHFKGYWAKYKFNKILESYLIKKKHWKLLLEEIDKENVSDILKTIPQLSWVHHINNGDYVEAKNDLSYLIRAEENLFYKKTYASLFTIMNCLELKDEYQFEKISLQCEASNILDHIKYQETLLASTTEFMPIRQLLFNKLFNQGTIIDIDLVLNSFKLISGQFDENQCELAILIWASVMLADPYLKQTDMVTPLSCKKASFYFECFSRVIEVFPTEYYPDNMGESICQFLNLHVEPLLSQKFIDRAACIAEICHDTLLHS